MSDKISRDVPPAELRADAAKLIVDNDDLLAWLKAELLLEAAQRAESFATSDIVKANQHDARATRFGDAIKELESLRTINSELRRVTINRVLVALTHAERPPWKATHQHYKGTLYRVTGTRSDAEGEELIEGVEYDDVDGHRYFLKRTRFESILDSGKARYAALHDANT